MRAQTSMIVPEHCKVLIQDKSAGMYITNIPIQTNLRHFNLLSIFFILFSETSPFNPSWLPISTFCHVKIKRNINQYHSTG